MAESLGTIYYDVDANLEPLLGKMRQAESALGGLGKEMGKTDRSATQMQKSFDRTERSAASLGGQLNGLTRVIRGVIAAMALKQMAGMVQEYQEMSERVRDATDSVAEFNMVQRRLQSTAAGTYRAMSEAQEAFIQASRGLRGLGYDTSQALDVVDSLSYAFVRNATSSDRAQSAMNALVRATNRGTVLTDHWASLLVAVPTLLDNIADATGRSAEEISALGYAGQLSARDLTEGLRKALDENRTAADEMANTLTDAGVRSAEAITSILVAMESQSGALDTFTNAIITAANWVQELAGDTDAMATIAKTLQVGVVSLAAVIAGRLTMAVIASTRAWFANAASMGAATVAANTLRGALAFLGGPAGIILLVAGAFLTMGRNARDASKSTDELTSSMGSLGDEMLKVRRIDIGNKIAELDKLAAQMQANIRWSEEMQAAGREEAGTQRFLDRLQRERGALEENRAEVARLTMSLEELDKEQQRRSGATGGTTGSPPPDSTQQELTEFQKLEQSLKNQAALAKLTGLARAELAALQRLGADATEEEQKRIKELVGEIYRLEEAQKAAQQAEQERLRTSEEARQAAEDNAGVIAGLREQLYQTTLAADDLAARQAELSLNDYATPEQVEQVRALARELYAAQQEAALLEQRRSAFTGDAAGAIRGQVSPLSGGAFDDQAARYAAEAAAEQERYAAQLERLREAKELEIEVIGGYQALEEQMAQEHADRMAQIDQARMQVMLAAGEQGYGAMADIMKAAFGEQSAAYKMAFAAQKVFAMAQAAVAIKQGIAMAAANPWPENMAAMASVAAATAGLVADISSITMAGGRLAGGPVNAGSMYRVNENGAPEVFSAANGQQFMIPNQRGEVVSNRDATAGGAGDSRNTPAVGNITINAPVTVEAQPGVSDQEAQMQGEAISGALKATIISTLEKESRPGGLLWGIYGGGR